jgi:hypothetical protein
MAALASASHGAWSNPGHGKHRPVVEAGQSLLNLLAEAARRAQDYSRFQGLSRRYLDDAGLTPAELDAALGVASDLEPALAHGV